MTFSSLVFLCVFLPLCLGSYYLVKNRTYRNWVLIIFSLFFYAWGEPVWIVVLLASTFFNYLLALFIASANGGKKKALLALAVTTDILILGFFKYSGFLLGNINGIFAAGLNIPDIALPIGISFYTFQIISYVADVYRGDAEVQKSPFKLLLYISMFHQLIAGPIVKYKDIAAAIDRRVESAGEFNYGVNRFIMGLGKKVILANTAGKVAETFMGADYSLTPVLAAWLGITFFAFQIYYDFSGYSDMAIGLGKMFGFTYKENFNYPYASRSATEFWRRWHISLSTFFRDYVYIPLGGNRRGEYRNLFLVWLLTGLWHGPSWNFVIWGLYYFLLILLERAFLAKLFAKAPRFISRLYLWLAVLVGWVFFYNTDLGQALTYLGVMFGFKAASFSGPEVAIHFWNNALLLAVAAVGATPAAKNLFDYWMSRREGSKAAAITASFLKPAFNLGVLILSIIFLAGQSYNPFLYFRF